MNDDALTIDNGVTRPDLAGAPRRLQLARAAIERRFEPTPDQKRRILRERAVALSRKPRSEQPAVEQMEVVEFLLAHERYAIESVHLREVHPLKDLTPLPGTPPFVLGITNVRGQIFTVIDLRIFFDLPIKGLNEVNKVLIVHAEEMQLGLLADAVVGVRAVPLAELQRALPTLEGIRMEYLRGVTSERLVVLDVAAILADPRIVVHEEVEV